MSDHDSIPVITIDIIAKKSKMNRRKIYLYGKAKVEDLKVEIENFNKDFSQKDLSKVTTESLWCEFKTHLQSAVDKFIPSKIVSGNKPSPWINKRLRRLHKRKQRAFNSAKKDPTPERQRKLKDLKDMIKKETRKR